MKKTALMTAAVVLLLMALGLAGCGGSSEEPEENNASMPNPWQEASTLDEAVKGAGIDGMTIDEGLKISLGAIESPIYRYMEGMVEVDVPIATADLTIRKGDPSTEMGEGDISGDYNEYSHDWEMTVGDLKVRCFGNREGASSKTIWSAGGYDFAILATGSGGDDSFGLSGEDVETLVKGVR